MANIPTLRVRKSNASIEDVHEAIRDVDLFYRRIVQYILNRIELVETESVLCHIIDDYNNKSKKYCPFLSFFKGRKFTLRQRIKENRHNTIVPVATTDIFQISPSATNQ